MNSDLRTHKTRLLSTALWIGLVFGAQSLTGCTPDTVSPSSAVTSEETDRSPELVESLADGTVTFDEYTAGYRRFVVCLSDAGYEVVEQGLNWDTYEYSVPQAAVDSGADEICYQREYAPLDTQWQSEHADSSYTAEVIRQCLSRNNIQPADSLDHMYAQLEEAGISFESCLDE